MIYIISYEPVASNIPNIRLRTQIQQYYGWKILGKYTFLIATDGLGSPLSIKKIKQDLSRCCLYGDKLFIAELGEQASWIGMDEETLIWLQHYSNNYRMIKDRYDFAWLSNQGNDLFQYNRFDDFNNRRDVDEYKNNLRHWSDELKNIK